ncbi:MAG: lysozyme inhibitor LprI family protein, partial [Gammaproteobacteria bacterium]|nr:lysozyme inhibitor LprI family protein [Gammaproteobacteria bacterium]
KTICGSVGLAAYDKSVSETYKKIRAYYRSKPNAGKYIKELKKNQREWLKKRNSCGNDEKCLENSMAKRISKMEYRFGMYLYRNR